jgi:flagellar biosynthesis/type III secretory pathway M-ring protein FliF/YscJ
MNQVLAYICAFLLVLCLITGFLSFRFYKQSAQKDDEISLLNQAMEAKTKEVQNSKDSLIAERKVLLSTEAEKLIISASYDTLEQKYENLQNETPETIIKYKDRIIQPSCSIPDNNFRVLKQAYCQNGNTSDYCSPSAPK